MMDTDEPAWVDRSAWSVPSRWVDVGEGRLRVADVGEGPVVLFSHGTPTWSFEWRHLISALSGNYRCIAPDHLGFGRSERPVGADYTPEAHAKRFLSLVEALDLRNITLIVHDYGGPFALPVALETDRVRRLVILNSFLWPFDEDPEMRARAAFAGSWLGGFLYRWANLSLRVITPSAYGDQRKLTPEIHAQYLAPFPDRQSRGEVLWALARALLGSSAFYRTMQASAPRLSTIPVTVIWGLADSAFRPHQLAKWRELVPHASFVELPSAGHWPHEEEPEAVLTAVRAALSAG